MPTFLFSCALVVLLGSACGARPWPPQGGGAQGLVVAPGSPIPVGAGIGRPVLVDMDGDGWLDIVVPHDVAAASPGGAGRVAVFLGRGEGSFARPALETDLPLAGLKVAVGDVDEDGNPDVVAVAHDACAVHVLFGEGACGLRDSGRPVLARAGEHPHTHSLALADVDADGHLDLVSTNAEHGDVSVLLGDGRGGFQAAAGSPYPVASRPGSVEVGDLDGDGRSELILGGVDSDVWVRSTVDGGALLGGVRRVADVGRGPGYLAVGDLDGDGNPDLVTGNFTGGDLSVLLGRP